jgi:hypothetical protein
MGATQWHHKVQRLHIPQMHSQSVGIHISSQRRQGLVNK